MFPRNLRGAGYQRREGGRGDGRGFRGGPGRGDRGRGGRGEGARPYTGGRGDGRAEGELSPNSSLSYESGCTVDGNETSEEAMPCVRVEATHFVQPAT